MRWSLARADRSGCDVLVLRLRDADAVLERQRGEEVTLERRASGCGPLEAERSSCGRFVAISVPGVIDAVFNTDGACVYARSAWISDLSPLGGQCECRGGELNWSDG